MSTTVENRGQILHITHDGQHWQYSRRAERYRYWIGDRWVSVDEVPDAVADAVAASIRDADQRFQEWLNSLDGE